jgi:hypothetical protein
MQMTRTGTLRRALALAAALSVQLAGQPRRDAGEWFRTGALLTPRYQHSATRLSDGRVLVAGGRGLRHAYLDTTGVFDPGTGEWTAVGRLAHARYYHSATLLQNGQVLVAGGINDTGHLDSVELFDPIAGMWHAARPMRTPRREHTATRLHDGRVLVAGGQTGAGTPTDAAEIYDPLRDRWTAVAPLRMARRSAAAALLPDGRVMVAGGTGTPGPLAAIEIFDPRQNTWHEAPSMRFAREYPTATTLPSGDVIVIGGFGGDGPVGASEIYSPRDHRWIAGGSLLTARFDHRVALLPDDRLLIAGGVDGQNGVLAAAELYDPVKRVFEPAAAATERRYGASATVLSNGSVLLVGGASRFNAEGESWLASSEVFASVSGRWQRAISGADNRPRAAPSPALARIARAGQAVLALPDGRVLISGGYDGQRIVNTTEIFDPATKRWSPGAPLSSARRDHTMSLLPNGMVMVAGGEEIAPLATTEILDDELDRWIPGAPLRQARSKHTATLLPNGMLLLTGGTGADSRALASTELYDTAIDVWRPGPPMAIARSGHTATLTDRGTVLVTGRDGQEEYVPFPKSILSARPPAPQIASVPRLWPGASGTIRGRDLTDRLRRSGGGFQHSPADVPTVTLLSLAFDVQATVSVGRWSATAIDIRIPANFPPGPALLTVSVGGAAFDTRAITVLSRSQPR